MTLLQSALTSSKSTRSNTIFKIIIFFNRLYSILATFYFLDIAFYLDQTALDLSTLTQAKQRFAFPRSSLLYRVSV